MERTFRGALLATLCASASAWSLHACTLSRAILGSRRLSASPKAAVLADKEIVAALTDEKYAMHISSITKRSEKEMCVCLHISRPC